MSAKSRKPIISTFLIMVAIGIVLAYFLFSNKSTTLTEDFIVIYSSYTDEKSALVTYSSDTQFNNYIINDIALENIFKFNGKYIVSSRYSGKYHIFENGKIESHKFDDPKGITFSYSNDQFAYFITNIGPKEIDDILYYQSGYTLIDDDYSEEYEDYNLGFFTTGTSFNSYIYILTFDPSIEKEQILKIDHNGDIIKKFTVSNTPSVNQRSLISTNSNIIYVTNNGNVYFIDDNDQVKENKINFDSEVLKVFENRGLTYIITYSGELYSINENSELTEKKLAFNLENRSILMQAEATEDSIFLLWQYDEKTEKNIGFIEEYSLADGEKKNEIQLMNIDDLNLTSFILYEGGN
nr:hypothetical protein [Evansella caseinilytica]